MISLNIEGVEELANEFKKLARKYPDRTGELLKKEAKILRKDVAQRIKRETRTKGKSKRSLAKAGSYKISPVKGYNENQYVEVSAKSPHFHLVEHGHELVMPKTHKNIGFVQGKHVMADAVSKEQEKIVDVVSGMVDTLLKEGGF